MGSGMTPKKSYEAERDAAADAYECEMAAYGATYHFSDGADWGYAYGKREALESVQNLIKAASALIHASDHNGEIGSAVIDLDEALASLERARAEGK